MVVECESLLFTAASKPLEDIHDEIIKKSLLQFLEKKKFPNLVITGPSGCNKLSVVMNFISRLYNGDQPSSNEIEFPRSAAVSATIDKANVLSGRGFTYVCPTDANTADLYLLKAVVDKYALAQRWASDVTFNTIIILEAQKLSEKCQAAMRRMMEKNISHIRFVLLTTHLSALTAALQSRCVELRMKIPPREIVEKELMKICQQRSDIVKVPCDISFVSKLCESQNWRLQRCLMALELNLSSSNNLGCTTVPSLLPHETIAQEIASICSSSHERNELERVRKLSLDMLGLLIPVDQCIETIYSALEKELKKKASSAKLEPSILFITDLASEYQSEAAVSAAPYLQILAFISTVMEHWVTLV